MASYFFNKLFVWIQKYIMNNCENHKEQFRKYPSWKWFFEANETCLQKKSYEFTGIAAAQDDYK